MNAKYTATWSDLWMEYEVAGKNWYSENGDEWFNQDGKPVMFDLDEEAGIVLSGGPRNGQIVA